MSGEKRIKIGPITQSKVRGKKMADALAKTLNEPM